MGIYDSSKTRVQPVFDDLKARPTTTWLPRLLAMGSRAALCRPQGFASAGTLYPADGCCYEYGVPAPRDYLKVLLASRGRLQSAVDANKALLKSSRDPVVEIKRAALLNGDSVTIAEGLHKLDKRTTSGAGTWWVLEGTTKVDCALFTDTTTVFIEGKRTEPKLTEAVAWDLNRHQVFRNLDVLRDARQTEDYFVLLIVEADTPAESEAKTLDSGYSVALPSWPHLSNREAKELYEEHYLGYITWQQIATQFQLTLLSTVQTSIGTSTNPYIKDTIS